MSAGAIAASSPARSRWLFGPVPDLLLGCGLGYAFVFAILATAGPDMRRLLPIGLLPLVAMVTGTPHYGATLLRVYERREDRRSYAFFAVWITAVIWIAFVGGLYHVAFGSLLVTVYLTWSPWHYTGQNYGIAVLFLRRRGIELSPTEKRHLYASFVLCFLITALAIHGESPSAAYAPASPAATLYAFLPLGIPSEVMNVALPATIAAYAYTILASAYLLGRKASARDLLPAAALVATQALWFAIPVTARAAQIFQELEPLSVRHAEYAFLWVAYAHSVQYLWITSYYARRSNASNGHARYLTKTLLAGAAIWGVPALVFAPGLGLAGVPYNAGLILLVAAAVNLHHFVLDGAIWKLRDGRIARILIRSAEDPAQTPQPTRPRGLPWRSKLVWAVGAACTAVAVVGTLEMEFGVRRASANADLDRIRLAASRLDRIGRDDPDVYLQLGTLAAQQGDLAGGLAALERSLELLPRGRAWLAIGAIHEKEGRIEQANAAYEAALELTPDDVEALHHVGLARLRQGDRDGARALLGRAVTLAPDQPELRRSLRQAMRSGPREST